MGIYKEKGVNFKATLLAGTNTEDRIISYINKKEGCSAERVDYKKNDYDLLVTTSSGQVRVEVKSHKGKGRFVARFDTFYAEIKQNINKNVSEPDYLYSDNIDHIYQFNEADNTVYVFNAKVLKGYINERLEQAKAAPFATSSGIKIGWEDKLAGFIGKFILTT